MCVASLCNSICLRDKKKTLLYKVKGIWTTLKVLSPGPLFKWWPQWISPNWID